MNFDPGRYRLYAGQGRRAPGPLDEGDFVEDFISAPVAQNEAYRQAEFMDWWVIFDTETGKFYSTWSTGRTSPHLSE